MSKPHALPLALALALPALPAFAGGYTIETLATVEVPPGTVHPIAINAAGTTAFLWRFDSTALDAYTHDGQLHFIHDGQTMTAGVDINDAGQLAFVDWIGGQDIAVLRMETDGSLTTVADTLADIHQFPISNITMNDNGEVAFAALHLVNGVLQTKIHRADGMTDTLIVEGDGAPFTVVGVTPSVNDAGMVSFHGGTGLPPVTGIFCGDGGPVLTLQDETGVFSSFLAGPHVNDNGTVLFGAFMPGDGLGLYMQGGGVPLTFVAGQSNGYTTVGGPSPDPAYAINDHGDVAFLAGLPGVHQGIYTGPDPVADKVIAVGDAFGGGTVWSLDFHRGLNDAGQIAFGMVIEMPNGDLVAGRYRADPMGPIAGDLDGDGDVDVSDLLDLLAVWGPCPAPCPPACTGDLDADCAVGISDLLLLLANWGP